jgi:opacity protein-like surface antigen
MKNFILLAALTLVAVGVASAEDVAPVPAPEIGATGIVSALGLVAGGLLVMRSRRKR